jgi:long-chain acyl-CoA synthetase
MKIGALLSQRALRHPERTAVILGERRLSFQDLDTRSQRLANALMAHGLTPGDRVVLYIGNSVELVEAIAAVWKAGGVVVPVTTWLVGPELAFMVADCRPFAVIYGPEQAEHVNVALDGRAEVVRIVIGGGERHEALGFEALLESGTATPLPLLAPRPDAAMIGYTSGTTGTPKGAVLTHANLIHSQLCTAAYWGLGLDDVYLVSTPIAHRTGLARLIAGFCLGVTLVVMPRFDAAQAVELIGRHRVTVMGTVPTVCRLVLEELERSGQTLESLRFMLLTGEACPIALKHRLAARLPRVKLISFYGSTEGGQPAALLADEQERKPASVGRPMPGVDIRLVDAHGREVPPGASGEIVIRSGEPGRFMVAQGYFNRPEANAEAFRDGWFHTGDVGRFDDEGYLYLVDRVKDMILSGGLNIYSREVEQAIEALPGVREVAVVAGPDAAYGECVVAYVACLPGRGITAEEVVAHCREHIASYKKPKHVFMVERLPRNVNGKVRKADLRARAARDVRAARAVPGGQSRVV